MLALCSDIIQEIIVYIVGAGKLNRFLVDKTADDVHHKRQAIKLVCVVYLCILDYSRFDSY